MTAPRPPSPRLPVTSYGYRPPPGATACGWRCPDPRCGQAECEPAPRWPLRCGCGSLVDPVLDEPWAHEAEALRLPHLLRSASSAAERDELRAAVVAWRYRDALRSRSTARAGRAREEGRDLLAGSPALDAILLFPIVHDALDHDRLDDAAAELRFWYGRVDTAGLGRDVRRRTNCLRLVRSQLDFLDHPAADRHPARPEVAAAGAQLRAEVAGVLTPDLRALAGRLRPEREWRSAG